MTEKPDCPWCEANGTLSDEWTEMGTRFCVCSCCGKRSRVDKYGAHRQEPSSYESDVQGVPITGP